MDDLDLGATIKGYIPGQKLFRRYTLTRILGRGGMGIVWLARDEELGRDTALKFLPEVVATDRSALDDLKREVRRAIDLAHPHIVKIHDFVTDGRTAAVSMEYVQGDTLSSLRVDQPDRVFTTAQLTPWVAQLCSALQYAHGRAQVVHRDLKPANLMVDTHGELKVLDFGIAASLSESVTRVSKQAGSSGTPVYMSPQQMMGEKPAVTDDLYALGATLYELLTGKPPFYSGNILLQVQNKLPPTLTERRAELGVVGESIPPEWEATIAACLAKEPKDRPQNASEVLERLGGGGGRKEAQKAAKTEPLVGPDLRAGRDAGAAQSQIENLHPPEADKKSKIPGIAAIAFGVVVLALAFWWFGFHETERLRVEQARIETERQQAESVRLEAERLAEAQRIETARIAAEQEAERQRIAAEQARLAAARGGVIVRTNPAGAEVRVGAVALEISPLTLRDQRLGKYPVRVRLEGYEDWDGEVEVKENDFAEMNVVLVRSTGTMTLTSEPGGLEAEVVGRVVPNAPPPAARQTVRTPQELKLPTGHYEVTFRRSGWPDQMRTLEVKRNRSVSAAADFVPGSLELTSTPSGAEVWSGGQAVGTTPYRVAEALPGRYDYEIKLKGYQMATAILTVNARQPARASVTLKKELHFTIEGLNLEMRHIAPGTFLMGSASGGASDEQPVTRVTLTKSYWLGATEVTQAQWQSIIRKNPSNFKGANLPVEQVEWNDVMEFCRRLTERERAAGRLPEGYVYTLPTEAQWEYACRAGTTGDFAGELNSMAWYKQNSRSSTMPVGMKQANAWGLYDMHGNVSEWCLDWYGNYLGGSVTDPTSAASGGQRVYRGGSWWFDADGCRSARRHKSGLNGSDLGFRLALAPSR
jgi:formylglycine-generating enzyme required for sulfatase activity